MPTISVIVPVYKVESYLHRCVDSLLAQTFEDFELILVDDGSPDNCPAICDEYAAKDSRVVVIHQKNGGLSAARNAGIDWIFDNSDSNWLSFIDSDDWVHPDYLKRLLDAAESNDSEVAFCTVNAFIEDDDGYRKIKFWGKPACGVRSGISILREASLEDGHLSGHHVIACNKIYKKEIFNGIRYPRGQLHEDEAVAHRIIGRCKCIVSMDDALYYYRQNPLSIMHSQSALFRSLCITLAYGDRILYFQELKEHIPSALMVQYWTTLTKYYYWFIKDPKCKKLMSNAKYQMRQVCCCYMQTDAHPIKKLGVGAFCRVPRIISILFAVAAKLSNG